MIFAAAEFLEWLAAGFIVIAWSNALVLGLKGAVLTGRPVGLYRWVLGLVGVLFCLIHTPLAQASSAADVIVKTNSGWVQGAWDQGVLAFKAIPFANSVAGKQRWLPPQPATPWPGVLQATQDAPACAQAARYNLTEGSDQENCLYLNVSVPVEGSATLSKSSLRPVLVWLHGGAFVGGASSLYRIDTLARKLNAVVVTVNYRLGVFGWMAHPAFDTEYNGGYALLDQRLAMRWVRDNIQAFGGDPNNVTLAGESAGGASVCMHLMTPEQTEGLFHKAIISSAACSFALKSQAQGQAFGQKVAEQVGCQDALTALACLQKTPLTELIAAGDQVAGSDLMAFAPVYGSSVLPRQGRESLESGQVLKMPVIFGGTRDELRLYVAYAVQAGKTVNASNYLEHLQAVYGEHASTVASRYPLQSGDSAAAQLATVMTHFYPAAGLSHCQYVDTVRLLAQHLPVFMMEFADRNVPVFGGAVPAKPDPRLTFGADQVIESWGTFMRTGIPAASTLPDWLPFNVTQQSLRVEPSGMAMFDPYEDAQCEFWYALYPDVLAALSR